MTSQQKQAAIDKTSAACDQATQQKQEAIDKAYAAWNKAYLAWTDAGWDKTNADRALLLDAGWDKASVDRDRAIADWRKAIAAVDKANALVVDEEEA